MRENMGSPERQSVLYLNPIQAEFVVNACPRLGGDAGLALGRAVSRASREIAASYLPDGFADGVPETVTDCFAFEPGAEVNLGAASDRMGSYLETAEAVRTELSKCRRLVPVELDSTKEDILHRIVESYMTQYATTPVENLAGGTMRQTQGHARTLMAVHGIFDKLMRKSWDNE